MSIARIKVTSNRLFKTADNVEKRTNESKKIAGGIGKTLAAQSVFKRQSIAKRTNIYQKRKDGIRRREQRDLFQASKSTSSIGRIGKVVTNSSKGFLGRVLDAIALTMVGWALTNLPTIISLSKQLGERMSKMSGVLSSFMTNTFSILQEIGTLSGAFIRNLVAFDFDDMGKQVDNSLSKVLNSFNRMELDFANALRLLVEPFDFEIAEEEQPPTPPPSPPGSPTPPTTPGPGPSGKVYGVNLRALADATSEAEGTYSSVGPTTYLGHGLGRYQFMTGRNDVQSIILNNAGNEKSKAQSLINRSLSGDKSAARQLLKYFPPSSQDSLFSTHAQNTLTQIKRKYPNADESFLVQKFGVYHLTGGDYPNSRDVNGTSGKAHGDKILGAYRKLRDRVPSGPPAPAQTAPAPVQPGALGSRPLQKGDVLTQSIGRGVSLITISDVYGSRGGKHGGIDITAPTGTWIALRVDCEWVGYKADFPYGPGTGYGHVLDVWAPELGVQLRFAHLNSKPNTFTKLKAGTSFAQVGSTGKSTGPHIHFEYTKTKGQMGYGSDADPSPYVPYILLTNKPNNAAFSVPGKGKATPARISGTNTAVTTSSNITPEKGEKTLVVAAPASMYQNPATMMGSSGGSPILVVGPSLNNLIKQRMLIELAYT